MGTLLSGLITGTCSGVWTWIKWSDRVIMVGSAAMITGMVLVGLAMVVVESAVTSIYLCYTEDPVVNSLMGCPFFQSDVRDAAPAPSVPECESKGSFNPQSL